MSKSKVAPIRPSIAKLLKRKIGGFVSEYEKELNRPTSAAKPADVGSHPTEPTTSTRQPTPPADVAAEQEDPSPPAPPEPQQPEARAEPGPA